MSIWRPAGALAAILGGLLRIADSFTAGRFAPGVLDALYVATDILLLFGVAAFWLFARATIDAVETAGLAVFAAGILTIRLSGIYQLGATIALLGLALYAIEALRRGKSGRSAPIAWLLALTAGVAGAFGVAPLAMQAAAGVAFGLGFVLAGAEMLGKRKRAALGDAAHFPGSDA